MPSLLMLIRLYGLFDVNEALLCVRRYPSWNASSHSNRCTLLPIFFIHTNRYIVIKKYSWNLDPPHFSRLILNMINNKIIPISRFSLYEKECWNSFWHERKLSSQILNRESWLKRIKCENSIFHWLSPLSFKLTKQILAIIQ